MARNLTLAFSTVCFLWVLELMPVKRHALFLHETHIILARFIGGVILGKIYELK